MSHLFSAPSGGTPSRPGSRIRFQVRSRAVMAPGLALAVSAAGCVQRETVVTSRNVVTDGTTHESSVRPGRNLPATFVVVTPPAVTTDCPQLLRDPGMQTELTLRSSVLQAVRDSLGTHYRAIGDYAVEPRGRYDDEQPGDGLRVDCARLRAMGIVRLGPAGS
jgi:hypothetical protein